LRPLDSINLSLQSLELLALSIGARGGSRRLGLIVRRLKSVRSRNGGGHIAVPAPTARQSLDAAG
jgi:hypothetical protein